ncbi:uncharacterized WD repeat-containing protein alr2800 [Aethina tumida]|uniref:uncharacterized WD repeat-containing protein alr2800 n=1 Tax=Aethina tumida TaxID=116153 RepID=UPI00096B635E|nr:uncharacterized WD repeat-containing protein alr2800 [Aethina tumida]
MKPQEISPKLIIRQSAAGPMTLEPKTINKAKSETMEVPPDMAKTDNMEEAAPPKSKEKEMVLHIDGKLICLSQIIAQREVLCVCYSEDFEYLAGGYTDGVIRMFRSDNAELVKKLEDTDVIRAPTTSMRHRPLSKNYPIMNTITSTYTNGCVKCWNYNTEQCIYTIREKRQTFGITYHPRLPKFMTYGDDANIFMYDEETRIQERILTRSDSPALHDGHTSRVYAGCFNPRSNHEFCSGGWDNVVHFWDLRQPHALRHLSGIHICGEGIDINQKGTELVTCAFQKEKSMQLWDYPTGKLIITLEPDLNNSKLYCGKFVGRDWFITGGADPALLRILDTQSYTSRAVITNLPTAVYAVDLGPAIKLKRNPLERQVKQDLFGFPRFAVAAGKGLYQFEPI